MALYSYSWLILFAPLFSFAVIIFGTRVWDMLSRPHVSAEEGAHGHEEAHAVEGHGSHGEDEGEHGLDDDEDPKVAHLTMGAKLSAYVGITIMALACIYSWVLLFYSALVPGSLPADGITVFSYDWLVQPTASYVVAFRVDTLAIAMTVVVTTVSLLVNFYSQGYMENSAGYARFFSYLSLFTFSMLVIVFAQNFLVIFMGWELVGLSSYLLIGFWINKKPRPAEDRLSPASAAIEAFITTRVGDVGFMIGIMILFANTGTFDFRALATAVQHMDKGLLTTAMILIFCGAIGKSAQLPLQVWLPPAMEGPTPVSALIHAATMVAAGVYMVARTYTLFATANPAALQVVAWVGTITALYAALTALTQTDFKRVLAFSTISQLGYMFVGLGVAGQAYGPGPGMFHLFTHAFFKALLFLGAGSVIHSLHGATHKEVQDMRLMGGLGPKMPITAITWLIAVLAISGFPFFSGFYSKDTIIGLAFKNQDYAIWILTLFTAGLTAFYMLRAYILAFGGKGGRFGGLWGGPYRGEGEPHESPITITIPLILLALASIIAGYWTGFFGYVKPGAPDLSIAEVLTDPLTWLGVVVAFIGLGWAWFLYARFDLATIHDFVESRPVLHFLYRLTLRKFYFDDLYALLVRYVVLGISHVEYAFDAYVIDGIVNGVARLVTTAGRDLRYTETGRVQSYMIGFFGGVVVLAVIVIAVVTFGGK
jgi:NADH-quinone oxidoreductase subunit L